MQIKQPSLAESFDYVYSADSAFRKHPPLPDNSSDDEKAAHEKTEAKFLAGFAEAHRLFRERGDDVHLEPYYKDGETPARWRIKHLRGKGLAYLRHVVNRTSTEADQNATTMMVFVACQLALKGVDGCDGPDGTPLNIERKRDNDTGLRYVTDSVMELLSMVDDGSLVFELGMLAMGGVGIPEK